MNGQMYAGQPAAKEYREESAQTLVGNKERGGVPQEMDRLESEIAKLGSLVSDLRLRLDPVTTPEPPSPTTTGLNGAAELRRPRCSYADGLEQFRFRIQDITRSVQNLHGRLDV